MALAFAGSDDIGDWLKNADKEKDSSGKYHKGFKTYVDMLSPCVETYRALLRVWGIEIDYIVGHSLGGAAATIYAQEFGNGLSGVATYGAPKTNFKKGTPLKGWRFYHDNDPVTSNLCFLGCPLKKLHHVTTRAIKYYDVIKTIDVKESKKVKSKAKKCKKKWWKFWCWFELIWTVVYEWVSNIRTDKCISAPNSLAKANKGKGFAHNFWNLITGIWGAIGTYTLFLLHAHASYFECWLRLAIFSTFFFADMPSYGTLLAPPPPRLKF